MSFIHCLKKKFILHQAQFHVFLFKKIGSFISIVSFEEQVAVVLIGYACWLHHHPRTPTSFKINEIFN